MSAILVGDVARALAEKFPLEWAEEWDRVGLFAGDPAREVTGVVLALDPTRDAIERTASAGANVLVTHHPAALTMPARLSPGRGPSGVLFAALDAGVALVNAHTNLDRAPAAGRLLPQRLALEPIRAVERDLQPMALITVFVPGNAAARVLDAMAGAGAGRIGEYEGCSFTSAEGSGTFTPRRDASPVAGAPGTASSGREVRIEMVAPRGRVRGVASAARAAHPYEEPLVTVAEVEIARSAARMGMLCDAGPDATLGALATKAETAFGVVPRVWGDAETRVEHVVTATGSAGSLVSDVIAAGAQALVAGEVRYHDALDAAENGLCVIEVGHDVSEWPLVALLHEVVLGIEGLDPAVVTVLPATPGWWTP